MGVAGQESGESGLEGEGLSGAVRSGVLCIRVRWGVRVEVAEHGGGAQGGVL